MTRPTDDELEAMAQLWTRRGYVSPPRDSNNYGATATCKEALDTAAMLRACKGRDTAAFEAGLNTALKIIASLGYGENQGVDAGHEEAYRAVETYLADWKGNKPSEPLSLAALNELTPEQKEANRNAAFAERGWIPAPDHSDWDAAIEAAIDEIDCGCDGLCLYPHACPKEDVKSIRALKKGQTND